MTLQAACTRFANVEDFTAGCDTCGCTLSPTEVEDFLDDASDLLYQLSGGVVFGECDALVRPVRNCSCGHYGWVGSTWSGSGFGGGMSLGRLCGYCLSCSEIDKIQLRTPVVEVTEVKIDGTILDPASYALTPRGEIYRVATDTAPPRWPTQQHLWKPDTEVGTFSIAFSFGRQSEPAWVRNACVELACELAMFDRGGKTKLPPTATAVTFQNVSVSLQSRAEALTEAKTYLPAVAQFIALTNPAQSHSWLYSPDCGSAWSFPLS